MQIAHVSMCVVGEQQMLTPQELRLVVERPSISERHGLVSERVWLATTSTRTPAGNTSLPQTYQSKYNHY